MRASRRGRSAGGFPLKAILLALLIYAGVWLLFFLASVVRDTFWSSQMLRVSTRISQHAASSGFRPISWRSAPKGIILEVASRSPVRGVIREVKPGVVAPAPFTLVPREGAVLILVEYPFRSDTELYLAVITETLRTWSMSPYFAAEPDATDAEYDALVRAAGAERHTKERSLAMLRRIAGDLPEHDLDPVRQ